MAVAFGLACLAALPGETATSARDDKMVSDLLILRSGAVEKGELKSYFDNRCQLGAKSILRDQIAWIGFATGTTTPPAITDPAHDEFHLRDGTVQSGRLVAMSLTQVVTEKSSYNRSEIAWIALAIEQGTQPRRSSGVAVEPCPADKPLWGYIEVIYVSNPYSGHDCRGTIRTVLRFPLVDNDSSTSPWSRKLAVGFHASEISYDVSTAGCVDTPGDDLTCQATGGRRTGSLLFGKNGWSGLRRNTGSDPEFYPLKPEMYFDALPDEIQEAFSRPLTCIGVHSGGMKATWKVGFGGGQIRPRGPGESDKAFVTFADSTGCQDRNSDCLQHPERYAVIPFSGHSVWTDPRPRADFPKVEMTWDICCGCNATHPEPQAPLPDGATKR
jgi:hypothetical protein